MAEIKKDYPQEILTAIDIVVKERIKKLGFNKCVRATIVGQDPSDTDSRPAYIVQHEQSNFKAYVLNGNWYFNNGDLVYVLYINNDFSNENSYIIGAVDEYLRYPDKLIKDSQIVQVTNSSVDLWWHKDEDDEKHTYLNKDGLQNTYKIDACPSIDVTVPEFEIGQDFQITVSNDLYNIYSNMTLSSTSPLLHIDNDFEIQDGVANIILNFTERPTSNVKMTIYLSNGLEDEELLEYEYYYTFVFEEE